MEKINGKNMKKNVLLITRLEAMKRLDARGTIKNVATDLGVGELSVGEWGRNRIQIEQFSSQQCNKKPAEKRK